MSLRFDAYIFDLDGTLLDTMDDFVAVTNAALAQMGGKRIYTRQEILDCFSRGGIVVLLQEEIGRELSEEKGKEVYRTWHDIFATHGLEHTKIYPHVKETLEALKERGAKLAVLSNKRDDDAKRTITHFFPGLFDAIHGESPDYPRKPNPQGLLKTMEELDVQPRNTAYVGDSAGDVNVAIAVGAFAVAVNYGYGTNGSIDDAKADATIARFNQLLEL